MLFGAIFRKVANAVGLDEDKAEEFQNKKGNVGKLILSIVILIVVSLVSVFVAKFMWNKFLVPTIGFVNPVKSYFQMLGVLIALQLLK